MITVLWNKTRRKGVTTDIEKQRPQQKYKMEYERRQTEMRSYMWRHARAESVQVVRNMKPLRWGKYYEEKRGCPVTGMEWE